jgi:hypothetical protein
MTLIVYIFNFSLAGYETAITVKKINETKIDSLQEFARNIEEKILSFISENELKLTSAELHNLNKWFFGEMYAKKSKEFQFKLGETELIGEIVLYIENSLVTNQNSYEKQSRRYVEHSNWPFVRFQ